MRWGWGWSWWLQLKNLSSAFLAKFPIVKCAAFLEYLGSTGPRVGGLDGGKDNAPV